MTDGRDHFGAAWWWVFRPTFKYGSLEVCKGRHRKHEPCYYEPATEQEVCLHAEIEAWKEVRNAEVEETSTEEAKKEAKAKEEASYRSQLLSPTRPIASSQL